MARRKQPAISDGLLDQLLAGADPKTAFAKDGLLDELKKAFAERALNAEIDHHLDNGEEDGRQRSSPPGWSRLGPVNRAFEAQDPLVDLIHDASGREISEFFSNRGPSSWMDSFSGGSRRMLRGIRTKNWEP